MIYLMELDTYTVMEVAHALRVDPATIRRWIKAGDIATVPLGKHHRIPKAELDRLLTPTRSTKSLVVKP